MPFDDDAHAPLLTEHSRRAQEPGVRGMVRRAAGYLRARLWEQLMRPDIEVIYQRGGMYAVNGFLQSCTDADFTKEVLSRFGAKIHPSCSPIGPNITIHEAPNGYHNLEIGANVHIGRQVFLDLSERVVLEDDVAVGMRVTILTHVNLGGGDNRPIHRVFPPREAPTILRRGCSIGTGSVITCGLEIGEDAVIGPGVMVVKNVPPRTYITSNRQKADYRIPDRIFDKIARDRERDK